MVTLTLNQKKISNCCKTSTLGFLALAFCGGHEYHRMAYEAMLTSSGSSIRRRFLADPDPDPEDLCSGVMKGDSRVSGLSAVP